MRSHRALAIIAIGLLSLIIPDVYGQAFQRYRISAGTYRLGSGPVSLPGACIDASLAAATSADGFTGAAGITLRRMEGTRVVEELQLQDAIARELVEVVGADSALGVQVRSRGLSKGTWDLVVDAGGIVGQEPSHVQEALKSLSRPHLAEFYKMVDSAEADLLTDLPGSSPLIQNFREAVLDVGWTLQAKQQGSQKDGVSGFEEVLETFRLSFEAQTPEFATARVTLVAGRVPDAGLLGRLNKLTKVDFAPNLSPKMRDWIAETEQDLQILASLDGGSFGELYRWARDSALESGDLNALRNQIQEAWEEGFLFGGARTRKGVALWSGRELGSEELSRLESLLDSRISMGSDTLDRAVLLRPKGWSEDSLVAHAFGKTVETLGSDDVSSIRRAVSGFDTIFIDGEVPEALLRAVLDSRSPSLVIDWRTFSSHESTPVSLILALPEDASEAARLFPGIAPGDAVKFGERLRRLPGANVVRNASELRDAVRSAKDRGSRPIIVANNVDNTIGFAEPLSLADVLTLGDLICCNSIQLRRGGVRVSGELSLDSLSEAFETAFRSDTGPKGGGLADEGLRGAGGGGAPPPNYGAFWEWSSHYAKAERAKNRKAGVCLVTSGLIVGGVTAILVTADDDD